MSLHARGKCAYEGLLTDGPPMAFSVNSPCTSLHCQKGKKTGLGSAVHPFISLDFFFLVPT
jgi:hypothetical protein